MDIGLALEQIITIERSLTVAGLTNPTQYRDAVLADGPIAFWRFGDASVADGSALADSSGNGRNATARNPVGNLSLVAGLLTNDSDKCITHATPGNTSDHVDLPDVAAIDLAGQALTLEFWIRSTSPGNFGTVCQKLNGASGWVVQARGAQLCFSYDANAHIAAYTASNLWDGIKHHVAITWDGINARFNVDGLLAQTVALAGTVVAGSGRVGKVFTDDQAGGSDFFGAIDELALYNKVLTLAQVVAHYNAGIDILPNTALSIVTAYRVPPPESQALPDVPCWINTLIMPDERRQASMRQRLYTVVAQLFVGLYPVEADISAEYALAFLELAISAFDAKQTLSGTVTQQKMRGSGGAPVLAKLSWGNASYVGLHLLLELQMIDAGTFGP